MKKIFSIVLSVCMIMMYTAPAFAYSSEDVVKIELSDHDMAHAVGASGDVDAIVASYDSSGNITAKFDNLSDDTATYSLIVIEPGGSTETLASGNVNPGKSVSASGVATLNGAWTAKACIRHINNGHLESCDARTKP